jgi:hypothetical protein
VAAGGAVAGGDAGDTLRSSNKVIYQRFRPQAQGNNAQIATELIVFKSELEDSVADEMCSDTINPQ